MITFGVKIKDLRKEKNLTQKELAQALSITVSTLSHWECGYQEPNFDDLIMIADYFEVSVDYLLGREDDFGSISIYRTENSSALSGDEQKIIDAIRENAPYNPVEWVALYASLPAYMQESIFAGLKGMHLGYKAASNKKNVN